MLDMKKIEWLKSTIRDIPDFPKPGIIFKDLTTLLRQGDALTALVDMFAENYAPLKPDYIAGIEARGFILATALAYKLGVGFIPIRKPGKLPHKTNSVSYELEYGTDKLEVHTDAVEAKSKVILIDDLLATGGTAKAACDLLSGINADVLSMGFAVELEFLNGRSKLPQDIDVFSVIKY